MPLCHGFLNLHKPAGLTSHDCVYHVRKGLRLRQVGHAGTLDPAATGVLPLAVGKATRFLSFLSGEKVYAATFRFGQRSTTDDAAGEIHSPSPCPSLTLADLRALLPHFTGSVWQRPPDYSAIRQQGKRLYELARAGLPIEVEPRLVQITQIQVTDWRPGDWPEVDLTIQCGSGTYIRAIARDLGERLGCGGLMSALQRMASNGFTLEQSISLADWQALEIPHAALSPIATAFPHLGDLTLSEEQRPRWFWGQTLTIPPTPGYPPMSGSNPVKVWDHEGTFLGLGSLNDDQLRPLRVLMPDD